MKSRARRAGGYMVEGMEMSPKRETLVVGLERGQWWTRAMRRCWGGGEEAEDRERKAGGGGEERRKW